MLPFLLAAMAVKPVLDSPPAITGNCNPARVHFTGHIVADAPGPAVLDERPLQLERLRVGNAPEPPHFELLARALRTGAATRGSQTFSRKPVGSSIS